jgi:hypothetical protein
MVSRAVPPAAPPIQRTPVFRSADESDERKPDERKPDDLADAVLRMPDRAVIGPARSTLQPKCTGCENEEKEPIKTTSPPAGGMQPTLAVGRADDPLEREADHIAEQVMRMPAPSSSLVVPPQLSRKCAACEEDEVATLRPKTTGSPRVAASEVPDTLPEVLRSSGQPLDAPTRAFFEPRFGVDFADVRLHVDSRAADTAVAVGALAYTVGSHIVLGPAQFPSRDGAAGALLAHELAHVVQQGGAPRAPRARGNAAAVQRTSAPLVQRAMRKGCVAPSFVVDFATASIFGTLAETLIETDYLATMGGTPFADVFLDNPLGPMSYIAFLASHHPSLDKLLLAAQISLSGGVLVPDILDTRGALEFYDVKPDSPDGRIAGRGKLAAIDAFMAFNGLPYGRGASYTPTPSLPIPLAGPALVAAITAILGPSAVTVLPMLAACGLPVATLAPRLAANGLLLYEVCVEADLDCYLKVLALEALIAAVILAALATDGASLPETVPLLTPALPI